MVRAEIISLRFGRSFEDQEMERRFLEFGFVEGVLIRILHEGLIGRDPLVVQIDDMLVALRRRQAASVVIRELGSEELP